jgi:serine/threonine protein kinase
MIGKKIQNYKILSLLGEGGMGVVYKALDIKLERFAALKILNLRSTRFSKVIERFRREARNHAKLNHPNIVSVYGFVEEKDLMGIAMEYVEGETLEQVLQIEGRLETNHALDIISQALEGISYAHEQGFIHRDLKPSNIIIDLNGNVKIMDFGISKSIDEIETITQHSARPGTLLYMSSEQLSGNEVTVKSDLYSLGITLYEMLTGFYPYDSKTFYEIVDSHVNKMPTRISDILTTIPNDVDEIILKAMGKATSNNYNTAIEFNNSVKSIIEELIINPISKGKLTTNNVVSSNNRTRKFSFANKLGNFFLFITFIVLAIIVYSVVKEALKENAFEDKKNNPLNYSQDYSKNPNYLEQTGWKLSPKNSNNNLNSIYFFNNQKGIIAGSNGLILKTFNGGQKWETLEIANKNNLNSICFVNSRVFCSGEKGTLLMSDFNLKDWNKVNLNTQESLFNIRFINDNIGFITGSNGVIMKSLDGGLTWQKIIIETNENLFDIGFSDDRTGFAVGWDGIILKTEDQGLTWHQLALGYKPYLKNILFINQFLGFIVGGEGLILRTEDGGTNWEKINIDSNSGLYKIYFENNEEGIILSNRGEIFKTNDAGKTWREDDIGKPVILNDIQKLSTGRFIIVGNNGSIFNSKVKQN